MPVLFQINVAANWGSHGRIAEEIGKTVMAAGWDSYIAYGRYANASQSHLVKVGSTTDQTIHGIQSLLLDRHGLGSVGATWKLIREIEWISPDVIHLHNIHGFYLNYPTLFRYLSEAEVPVVWTFHDCWPFTGHCAQPAYAQCNRWTYLCESCPLTHSAYPKSYLLDRSTENFLQKQREFTSVPNLHVVTVSKWLEQQVRASFLKEVDVRTIYNGIDTSMFRPSATTSNPKLVLGVANKWYDWKGLDDFYRLRQLLPSDYDIVLVGLDRRKKRLPKGISAIPRTDSVQALVNLYGRAAVYVNPSRAETFGMTTAEALACGTPAVVYQTTACPELIDGLTGAAVPLGDVESMAAAVRRFCETPKETVAEACRKRAVQLFDSHNTYKSYLGLYEELLRK